MSPLALWVTRSSMSLSALSRFQSAAKASSVLARSCLFVRPLDSLREVRV
ncbi:MAG: hypothetical protein PVH21_11855 [Myxococcales bacterium]